MRKIGNILRILPISGLSQKTGQEEIEEQFKKIKKRLEEIEKKH